MDAHLYLTIKDRTVALHTRRAIARQLLVSQSAQYRSKAYWFLHSAYEIRESVFEPLVKQEGS